MKFNTQSPDNPAAAFIGNGIMQLAFERLA